MPEVRKCSIYGCRGNSRDKDLKFFSFPARDSPLYDTWLSICHESEHTIRALKRPYICSNHFHPWHVGFKRLALGALPSLHLKAPPGFAEEELAWAEEVAGAAAQRKKDNFINLINQSVFEWTKRAECHPEFGTTLCTSRRELQRIGSEIRNLLGATLTINIDDYWLRMFRKSHLSDSDNNGVVMLNGKKAQSLDLIEIIKSIDPNAKISSEEEIAILVDKEQNLAYRKIKLRNYDQTPFDHCPPENYSVSKNKLKDAQKISFKQALDKFYGVKAKNNNSNIDFKVEKVESIDASQDDDDSCVDVYSEDTSGPVVMSEPIVETYQQALEHLKPLEDFALREENYRAIGLLSTLEIIFKNHRPKKT